MAEIEKDLPDPLDTPLGGSSTDPDDLVAQLAGDAIDRLLEDAERGIVPPRPKPEDDPLNEIDPLPTAPPATSLAQPDDETPPHHEPTPDSSPETTAQAPDHDLTPARPPATHAAPEPEPTPVQAPTFPTDAPTDPAPADIDETPDDVPPAMQAELDSLFHSLGDDPTQTPASDAVPADVDDAAAAPAVPELEPRNAMPPPMDVPPEIASDDGHGGAATAEPDDDDSRPADLDTDASLQTDVKQLLDDATQHAPPGAPAFIVAPLRLINAPFAGLSDSTRDILGQIALVTLVNATAILVYVLFFR